MEAIEGCTAVTDSGKATSAIVAEALVNRGDAYRLRQNDLDRAIADFDQAIRLRPTFSIAYRDRGKARQAKGDVAGGAADLAEAERIGRQKPLDQY